MLKNQLGIFFIFNIKLHTFYFVFAKFYKSLKPWLYKINLRYSNTPVPQLENEFLKLNLWYWNIIPRNIRIITISNLFSCSPKFVCVIVNIPTSGNYQNRYIQSCQPFWWCSSVMRFYLAIFTFTSLSVVWHWLWLSSMDNNIYIWQSFSLKKCISRFLS